MMSVSSYRGCTNHTGPKAFVNPDIKDHHYVFVNCLLKSEYFTVITSCLKTKLLTKIFHHHKAWRCLCFKKIFIAKPSLQHTSRSIEGNLLKRKAEHFPAKTFQRERTCSASEPGWRTSIQNHLKNFGAPQYRILNLKKTVFQLCAPYGCHPGYRIPRVSGIFCK